MLTIKPEQFSDGFPEYIHKCNDHYMNSSDIKEHSVLQSCTFRNTGKG